MRFSGWRDWLKRLPRSSKARAPRRWSAAGALQVESLEQRLTPTVRTWSGAGPDNLWTDANNWVGNVAPVAGDDLVFAAGAGKLTNANNFASNTDFHSITFQGTGYSITGNGITLGDKFGIGSITDNSGGTLNSLNIAIQFSTSGVNKGTETFTAANGTLLTITGNISGVAGVQISKVNTGTIALAGDDSGFLGPITINQGALEAENATALGATNSVNALSGATLQVANLQAPLSNTLVLSGSGASGGGALESVSGNNTIAGNVTFSSNVSFGVDAGALTMSGTLGDNLIGYTFTKVGPGTLILSHANTYAGPTLINAGILNVQNALALGGTTNGVTVSPTTGNTAALQIQGVSVSNKTLSLNGPGVNNLGALENVSGNDTWTGTVTLSSSASIGADTGSQLTLNTFIRQGASASNLTKEGTGALVLTQADNYTGTTTVDQGVLNIQNPLAVGGSASQGVIVNGRASLQVQVSVVNERLTLNGPGFNNTGAIDDTAGLDTWSGPVTLATDASLGAESGTQLTVNGGISGPGGFTKYGPGQLVLPTGNTYLGTTIISNGVVTVENNQSLGVPPPSSTLQASTIVQSGGALALDAQGLALNLTNPLSLAGTGINNTGAVHNVTGTNLISGNVILIGNATIGVDSGPGFPSGSQLTLSGNISESGGSYGLAKVGPDRLILSGYNYYSGPVTIAQGTLTALSDTALGTTKSGTSVTSGAVLEIEGGIEIGNESLTLNGFGISNGGALVNVSGDNRFDGPITFASNVGIGTNLNSRLTLNGVISDNSSGLSLTKSGPGNLVLAGANTYSGGTNVNAGIINVQNNSALGSNVGAVSVASGASLELQTGVTISDHQLTTRGAGPTVAETVPLQWFPIGPAPVANEPGSNGLAANNESYSGRIAAIATDPSNPNIFYVAPAGGGVWKTTDGGINWVPLLDNVPGATYQNMFMGALAVSQTNPNLILAGTGEGNFSGDSFYGRGIWRSTDGGATWHLYGNSVFDRMAISKIAIDPTNSNIVFATTESEASNGTPWLSPTDTGVLESTDGGMTWSYALSGFTLALAFPDLADGSPPQFTDVLINSSDPSIILAAVGTPADNGQATDPFNGIYISTDDGATWAQTGYGDKNGVIRLASSPADPFIVYASAENATGGLNNIEISVDGGFTWAPTKAQPANYLGQQGFYDQALAVSPTNPLVVYAAGQVNLPISTGFVESTNGGNSWSEIGLGVDGSAPHTDHHALAFTANGKLLAGSDGGIFELQNPNPGAQTWLDLNSDLQTIQFYGIGIDMQNPSIAWGGSQDNGTMEYTGSQVWNEELGGDGTTVQVDPTNGNVVYATIGFGLGGLVRTTDGGKTFFFITNGINLGDPTNAIAPFVLDASSPDRLVAGTNVLYETLNQGNSWTAISAPFTNNWNSDQPISAIGLAYNDPQVIYAATDDGKVFVTTDHGTTAWQENDFPVNANGNVDFPPISSLKVDPNSPNIAYATVAGFTGGGDHVFRTTDYGQHWVDISTTLPDIPVWTLLIDPRPNPNILYIGTDNGVYYSTNLGQTWSQFGTGMPNTQVVSLALDPLHDYIAAGTHGRGMFEIYLDPAQANAGAVRAITGNDTWSGNITISGNATIGADVTTSLLLSGSIVDGGTGSSLTKIGAGKVTLASADSYGGPTTVVQGILDVQNSQSLGTNPSVTVDDGATLTLEGDGLVFTETLTLGGPGVGNTGALYNTFGNNTWTGPVVLADNTSIFSDANSTLTISGSISDNSSGGGPKLGFIKGGPGTLVLSGTNSYSGNTTIAAGDIDLQNVSGLGSGLGTTIVDNLATLSLDFPTTGGPYTITGEGLVLNGPGFANDGALKDVSGSDVWAGNVSLATSSSLGASDPASPMTISGVIADNSAQSILTKEGIGTVVLAGTNSYSAGTVVVQGVLELQNSSALGLSGSTTIVDQGATVQLDASITGQTLHLNGTGVNGEGALFDGIGNDTWNGAIILDTTTGIGAGVDAGNNPLQLTVTDVINFVAGQGITGQVTSVLEKLGPGTVIFPTANNYQGQTLVTTGILEIENAQALGASGGSGTFVTDGATLQLAGNLTITGKTLGLTGSGVNGKGALENLSGSNTWQGSILLIGDSTIGVDNLGDTFTENQIISQALAGSSLTKVGAGSMLLSGGIGTDNTYFGSTFVDGGTLLLDKTGAVPIQGDLIIGAGTGAADSTVVRWLANNQLSSTTTVTVNSDGLMDLNGHMESVAGLTINDGTATTNTGGVLTINGNLAMVGGTLQSVGLPSEIVLGTAAAVSAVADASQAPASIDGDLSLGGTTRTFSTTGAGAVIDLDVNAVIHGSASEGLTVTGTGILDLKGINAYTGPTTVSSGTLLVDGQVGAVIVTGGELGGEGTVASITASGGSVSPGSPPATNPGPHPLVVTGSGSLASASGYVVQLNGVGPVGTASNVLSVNGTLNLDSDNGLGSSLTGHLQLGYNPPVHTQFTIIQAAGGILGTFNGLPNNATVYFDGVPFQVNYTTNTVVIMRLKADSTVGLVSSSPTVVYSAPLTFTATVTGNPASIIVPTGNVLFTLTGAGGVNIQQSVPLAANGVASWNVQISPPQLAPGTYTVFVTYSGDSSFNPSSSSNLTETVTKDNSVPTLTSSSPTSVYGQPVTFTVTLTPQTPGTATPTGSVIFTLDGTQTLPITLVSGVATLTPPTTLSVGTHTLTVSYSGDSNFNPSSSSSPFVQSVVPDNTNITNVASSAPTAVYGQAITFTTTVTAAAPGAGSPTGVVTYFDGANVIGIAPVIGGSAALTTTALSVGSHQISATYSGDGNFNPVTTSTTTLETITKDTSVSTSVSSSISPSVFGQSVTLSVTVTASAPGSGIPTGSVTFFDGGLTIGTAALGNGTASFTTSSLAIGTHSITTFYQGDGNFLGSSSASPAFPQQVNADATIATISSSVNPSAFGQTVIFTANVSSAAPGSGTPTGVVFFYLDGVQQPGETLNAGSATFSSATTLSSGQHSVSVTYVGNADYLTSSSLTLTQIVNKVSTLTSAVTASVNPSTFGQSVTFTATVTPTALGAALPTGLVTFLDGTNQLGTASLVGSTATLVISTLSGGSHSITASYAGDNNFTASTSGSPLTQTVNLASTTTSVVSSSANPSIVGEPVTLTASVSTTVSPTIGVPSGSISFFDGSKLLGTSPISSGAASFITTALSAGTHFITASYSGDGSFNSSSSLTALTQTVNTDGSVLTVTSTNPTVFGQAVTFTVTVTGQTFHTVVPTGTVVFTLDGTAQPSVTLANGQASFTPPTLSVGSHTLIVAYNGDSNFSPGTSGTYTQVVNKASSSVTVTQPIASPVYGQPLIFNALVAAVLPGTGTPTGTITLTIDGSTVGAPVGLSSGAANFPVITSLTAGSHNITVTYSGDGNFLGTTSTTFTQVINQDSTSTAVVSASPSAPVTGQPITFTASVTANAPGGNIPTGTVTFFDSGVQIGVSNLSGGSAIITLGLTAGNHAITATYSGDPNFIASGPSSAFTEVVGKAATTSATVVSLNNPSILGQAVTFTLQVTATSPGAGIPTGTVTFFDGTATLGTSTLGAGQASFTTTSPLAPGNHSITAAYAGDANFNPSTTSTTLVQVVNRLSDTIALSSSTNPSFYGQSVVTATVTPGGSGFGNPTGTVTFSVDGVSLTPVAVDSTGKATLSGTAILPGTHSITATYSGDTNFTPSSTTSSLSQTVQKVNTSTVLSGPATSVFGQSVTFTAAVSVLPPGSAPLTGNVVFTVDGNTTAVAVDGTGHASLTISSLSVGGHNISAAYAGDSLTSTSTSPTSGLSVSPAQTAVGVVSSSNPVGFGTGVTFTATVSVLSPGNGTPTGTVTFFDASTALGSASLSGTTATFSTTLSVGTHAITASYNGNGSFATSSSSTLSQIVSQASVSLAAVVSQNPVIAGRNITVTVTVTPQVATVTPTGTVTVTDNGSPLAVGTLSGGQAVITVSLTNAGAQSIGVGYGGDGNYSAASNASLVQETVITGNQAYVAQVYLDLLHRTVDSGGLAYWTGLLSAGATRTQVALGIEGSLEYKDVVVQQLYQEFLHRNADPGGLSNFANQLLSGVTVEQVEAALIGSQEYFQDAGSTNAGFVSAMYRDVLHRAVDPTGQQYFLLLLQEFTPRSAVAATILKSGEAMQDVVANWYETYLHRPADSGGLGAFTNELQHGFTDEQVIAALVGSAEYFANL